MQLHFFLKYLFLKKNTKKELLIDRSAIRTGTRSFKFLIPMPSRKFAQDSTDPAEQGPSLIWEAQNTM